MYGDSFADAESLDKQDSSWRDATHYAVLLAVVVGKRVQWVMGIQCS